MFNRFQGKTHVPEEVTYTRLILLSFHTFQMDTWIQMVFVEFQDKQTLHLSRFWTIHRKQIPLLQSPVSIPLLNMSNIFVSLIMPSFGTLTWIDVPYHAISNCTHQFNLYQLHRLPRPQRWPCHADANQSMPSTNKCHPWSNSSWVLILAPKVCRANLREVGSEASWVWLKFRLSCPIPENLSVLLLALSRMKRSVELWQSWYVGLVSNKHVFKRGPTFQNCI